jgi:predicted nucleotidyltransferase component of viral defense system
MIDRYATSEAFRAALEDRLKNRAADTGTALDRLRRRVVFERMLARLEVAMPGRWVVKGGMALEIRLTDRARRTRDLDLAIREDTADLHEQLVDALTPDPFGDGFQFLVASPKPLSTDDAGRPGWRFGVGARLAGRGFERVTMDVVERPQEIVATVREVFPTLVDFAGLPAVSVEVIEPRQHFAEKLHAYTRDYGERANTRSRDLPDMVLLIEDGLVPDRKLYNVVKHVFDTRNTHSVPDDLPDAPALWAGSYEELTRDLDVGPKTLDEAVKAVLEFWARTVTMAKE